jgi:hypothetical protein
VDPATVSVACLYRQADEARLDLLTLNDTCIDGRRLEEAYVSEVRQLSEGGFHVQVEIIGSAVEQIAESGGSTTVAEGLGSTEVVIKSELIPGGNVTAATAEIDVAVQTQAPAPSPTALPMLSPGPFGGGSGAQLVQKVQTEEPTPASGIGQLASVAFAVVTLAYVCLGLAMFRRGRMAGNRSGSAGGGTPSSRGKISPKAIVPVDESADSADSVQTVPTKEPTPASGIGQLAFVAFAVVTLVCACLGLVMYRHGQQVQTVQTKEPTPASGTGQLAFVAFAVITLVYVYLGLAMCSRDCKSSTTGVPSPPADDSADSADFAASLPADDSAGGQEPPWILEDVDDDDDDDAPAPLSLGRDTTNDFMRAESGEKTPCRPEQAWGPPPLLRRRSSPADSGQ